MTDPARQRRVDEICDAALDREAGARAAFVVAACGDDHALRADVEALLAHAHEAEGFLAAPMGAVAAHVLGEADALSLVGRQIGAYRILSHIGSGGMGEVYRARDTKLGRDVAIKVLPSSVANDPERLARLTREARTLAALSHPHIATIHGLEDADGVRALVMELVEGPTLADKLAPDSRRTPKAGLPLAEGLKIGGQIAEALEAAHEKGIIHRDLKPANIALGHDGHVKVLDFGLARAFSRDGTGSDVSHLPTITAADLQAGVIAGTPAYMSPEQARGQAIDKRTDIWAFGCVLYEMLTGRAAFAGETISDTIAVILDREPEWGALPASTPAGIAQLLRRCLDKDPKRRLRDIGDARIEIEDALTTPSVGAGAATARGVQTARLRRSLPWAVAFGVAAIAVAVVAGWFLAHRPASQTPAAVVRLSIPSQEPPSLIGYGSRHVAISEDGSRVAYASGNRLWIRRMGQQEAVAIEVMANNPFFSPNGEWVGFFGQIAGETGFKKVPAAGGTPVPIAATSQRPGGGTWRADGTIVFATSEGLYQVSENGGEPRLLVKPDPQRKERRYMWPQFMPDGQSLLFTILRDESIAEAQIAVLDMNTLEVSHVLTGGTDARYASTGHLVYASGPTLKAIAFDADTHQTAGDSVSIPDIAVATTSDSGAAEFAVSGTGTLLYITPTALGQRLRTLSWVDRQGKEEPLAIGPGSRADPRISPDGTRVALDIRGASRDIWIWNFQRASLTKLTSGPTEDFLPVWSRDSRRVFFASDRTGNIDVYSQAADGASKERVEFAGPGAQFPNSLTPDGAWLIVGENFKDVSVLNLARPDRLEPLLHGEFVARLGAVSPDGNWIAYESNESGDRFEIFLRPFPNPSGGREKVSIAGGRFPVWGPKGSNELFFVDLDGGVMAASVTLSPSLSLGPVTRLFEWEKPPSGASGYPYDVSPLDGRFLFEKPVTDGAGGAINVSVVLGWNEELKRLVPNRR